MQTKPPSIAHSERRFMSSLSENASPTEDSIVTHGNQMDPSFVSEETFATFNSIFGPLSKVTKTAMGGGNVCPTCSKTFDRLYNLKVHLRKHTGETPYHCPIERCPKQFKWRSSMAHHVRAHHNGTNADITSVRAQTTRQPWKATLPISGIDASKNKPARHARILPAAVKSPRKKGRKPATTPSTKLGTAQGVHKVISKCKDERHHGASAPEGGLVPLLPLTPEDSIASLLSDAGPPAAALEMNSELDFFDTLGSPFKLVDEGVAAAEGEHKLLHLVSDMLGREEVYEADVARRMDARLADEALEIGMSFLAAGSENATDAEMECLAQSDGVVSTPGSNETRSPGFRGGSEPQEMRELV